MENNGWFRVYYQMKDWEWKNKPEMVALFIHLLLYANWEDKQWHGITIKRGSLITSLKNISADTGISTMRLRTSLNRLKSTNEITIKTTNKFTIITVNNFDKYQQSTNKLTNNQQTTNKQLTTTKEYKNIRNKESSVMSSNNEISNNQKEIISFWNDTYGKNYKTSLGLENNIDYWLKKYNLLEIKTAIKNIKYLYSQEFWRNMRPVLFFSRKNSLGEADYIETALNTDKEKGNTSDELLKQLGL